MDVDLSEQLRPRRPAADRAAAHQPAPAQRPAAQAKSASRPRRASQQPASSLPGSFATIIHLIYNQTRLICFNGCGGDVHCHQSRLRACAVCVTVLQQPGPHRVEPGSTGLHADEVRPCCSAGTQHGVVPEDAASCERGEEVEAFRQVWHGGAASCWPYSTSCRFHAPGWSQFKSPCVVRPQQDGL